MSSTFRPRFPRLTWPSSSTKQSLGTLFVLVFTLTFTLTLLVRGIGPATVTGLSATLSTLTSSHQPNLDNATSSHLEPLDQQHTAAITHKDRHRAFPTLNTTTAKYAYATFYSEPKNPCRMPGCVGEEDNMAHDNFLINIRIMIYQFLHAPETRTTHDYPFVVLVTSTVPEYKRQRLRQDGAIVHQVADFDPKWVITPFAGWSTVMTKLRAWELTQFERILLMDSDTVLARNLDDIFDDDVVRERPVNKTNVTNLVTTHADLPDTYVFSAVMESIGPNHETPPHRNGLDWPNYNYLNAGFVLFKPDKKILNAYAECLDVEGAFKVDMPEQNLWNYFHSRSAAVMPWTLLDLKYNFHKANIEDVKGGIYSLHTKWRSHNQGAEMDKWMQSWRWRMQSYFEARDLYLFSDR